MVNLPVYGHFFCNFSLKLNMQDPDIKSLNDECDPSSLIDLFSEIPPWVKHPDFERVSLKKINGAAC